jgi:hypothetical protein
MVYRVFPLIFLVRVCFNPSLLPSSSGPALSLVADSHLMITAYEALCCVETFTADEVGMAQY